MLILKFITMKTFLKTLIILFIGVSFSSCDDIESLADIDFTSNMSTDLNVVVPATGVHFKSANMAAGVSFSEQSNIDPKSDSNFNKYIDKIKSIKIQEASGTVTKISKPVKIESGTLSIFQGTRIASWSISNFDVTVGKKIILDSAEGQFDTLNQILNSKNVFTAKIEGTVDDDDVSFTVVVSIKAEVVANPLN